MKELDELRDEVRRRPESIAVRTDTATAKKLKKMAAAYGCTVSAAADSALRIGLRRIRKKGLLKPGE